MLRSIVMSKTEHLDIEKVSTKEISKAIKIAKLQGQWTSASALRYQAKILGGTPEHMMKQFDVHIERAERELKSLGAFGRVKLG